MHDSFLFSGVPKLKKSELEAACEDFSNVIGSSPIGTVYKGTLSSGVEIAVTSIAVTSAKEWSTNLEAQFRDKVDQYKYNSIICFYSVPLSLNESFYFAFRSTRYQK